MSDHDPSPPPEPADGAADAPEEAPAEQPARRRRRRADAGASAEQPPRTRARGARGAQPSGEEADARDDDAAEEAPKPRRRRAPKPAREPAEAGASPASDQEQETADAEPPAPRRSRRVVEPPSLPRLRRRRRTPERAGEAPVVYATAKYVRSSPRKARLVCDHIRGKSVTEARAILAFAPRGVAKDWAKLLESAVANAEHNHELLGEDLRIKEVFADAGPTLKRFTPRAQGRATPIHKRTSHLSIALTPKE